MAKEKTVCDICNFDYKSLDELNEHHLQKHLDGKFKLCLYCDKRFPNWLNLKCHIDRKHPEHGEKIHLCDLCGKGFIFQDSCKSHKKAQHEKAYVKKEMSKLTKQNSGNQERKIIRKQKRPQQTSKQMRRIVSYQPPCRVSIIPCLGPSLGTPGAFSER